MKFYNVFLIALLFMGSCESQDSGRFKVVKAECKGVKGSRIVLNDSKVDPCSYSFEFMEFKKFDFKEKILLAKELLSFEKDHSLSAAPSMTYNVLVSSIADLPEKYRVSTRIEALYLINILLIDKPESYSPTPAIFVNGKYQDLKDEDYKNLYTIYGKWISQLEAGSLKKEPDLGKYSWAY